MAELRQWEPSYPSAVKLAQLLREAREFGDRARIPEGVPLLGGTGLGDLLLGEAPEGIERIGYGERLTSGRGQTLHLRPEVIDAAMLAGSAAGTAAKTAPRVVRAAGRAAENARAPSTMRMAAQRGALDFDPGPRAVIEEAVEQAPKKAADEALKGFGQSKKAREKALAKRTAQAAEAPVKRAKGAGERVKQSPFVWRDFYEQEGPEALIAAGERGKHLKPLASGGYAGGPNTVLGGPQLGAMRKRFDSDLARGIDALEHADPERLGTWYDRAKAAQAQIHEPHQLDRGLDQTAVYSAGVSPESELAFALKHQNTRALGTTDEIPYRVAPAQKLDAAVASGQPAKLSAKVGEYRNKNDPRVEETNPFGVNDFRMAGQFGYTLPDGSMLTQVSPTMHPFMDMETALAVNRANTRAAGGRTDWTGARMQEIPWVLSKAEDIYERGKNARFSGGAEGMARALREANNTIEDYLPKHAASATYEYVPGANVGHVPELLDAPMDVKRAYGQEGAWATQAPMDPLAEGMPASVGAGPRDALYRAAGFKQQPTIEAVGQYENSLGAIENNPVNIARPLMDFATGTVNEVNPNTLRAVEAIEGLRGTLDAQEAAAMNLPVTAGARKGKTSVLLERGTQPTAQELQAITQALRDTGMGVTPTNRGALLMDFSGTTNPQRMLLGSGKKPGPRTAELAEAYPGAEPSQAAFESVYVPGVTPASEAGQGIATARSLQRFADAPPELARNVSESDEIRRLIGAKRERDAALGTAREDIQRTREFFSTADWNRVVELMRQGVKPAAALAAVGYSLQGMAAEPEQR